MEGTKSTQNGQVSNTQGGKVLIGQHYEHSRTKSKTRVKNTEKQKAQEGKKTTTKKNNIECEIQSDMEILYPSVQYGARPGKTDTKASQQACAYSVNTKYQSPSPTSDLSKQLKWNLFVPSHLTCQTEK